MSKQVEVEENELHTQNLVPNFAKLEEYGEKQKTLKESIREANKTFRPDMDHMSKYLVL